MSVEPHRVETEARLLQFPHGVAVLPSSQMSFPQGKEKTSTMYHYVEHIANQLSKMLQPGTT